MPNLVVYVPTSLWKRIEELGLSDPKVEARKVAVGALERYVTDGRLSEGAESYSERPNEQPGSDRSLAGRDEKARPSGVQISSSASSESRVDPSMCGMANRHRSRSKANPCPRCGYPR